MKIDIDKDTLSQAEDVPFSSFVHYLESVASRRPRSTKNKKGIVDSLNKTASDFHTWSNHLSWPTRKKTGAIIFRLLFPEQDIRRRYNIKETQLARHLANILQVSTKRGTRGEALAGWNDNCEDKNGVELGRDGCLGLEVAKIQQEMEVNNPSKIMLADVDQLLDELAARCQWSNLGVTKFQHPPRPQAQVLKDLYVNLSARESAFMTQIILKDLRPLLYPLPSSSTYQSLMHYNSSAFEEMDPYSMMKAWHWAMPRLYRTKADFDRAADLCEQIPRDPHQVTANSPVQQLVRDLCKPELGTPVNIPKAVKASGTCLAANLSKLASDVWAETKMDGERMQIHIDIHQPESKQIQIFSKSHRDSTKERASTHVPIRAALGLPCHSNPKIIASNPRPMGLVGITTAIFEAEMIAWNMTMSKVDEFWRISELKLKPWQNFKHIDHHSQQAREEFTQEVTESQIDLMNTQQLSDHLLCRHLAICFFDVIYLNGESLIDLPYSRRREMLEQSVQVIPHYSMLVDRKEFNIGHPSGRNQLREYFATIISERHEGLMLKTVQSKYNDMRPEHRWYKVKKDYIAGFGDTLDYAIVGAGWDRDRARELRVSTAAYISWFIGLCDNVDDIRRDPSIKPNFQVVFKALSYGLSREQLERLNQIARDIDGDSPDSKNIRRWPFTYRMASGLGQPKTLFKEPLVFELMGSGFTKQSRNHAYELRWPRITKFYEPQERSWKSAVDLRTHDQIARRAVDPHILRVSDMIHVGENGKSKNGYKAELEGWNQKLAEVDSKWLSRNPRLESIGSPCPRTTPFEPTANVQSTTSTPAVRGTSLTGMKYQPASSEGTTATSYCGTNSGELHSSGPPRKKRKPEKPHVTFWGIPSSSPDFPHVKVSKLDTLLQGQSEKLAASNSPLVEPASESSTKTRSIALGAGFTQTHAGKVNLSKDGRPYIQRGKLATSFVCPSTAKKVPAPRQESSIEQITNYVAEMEPQKAQLASISSTSIHDHGSAAALPNSHPEISRSVLPPKSILKRKRTQSPRKSIDSKMDPSSEKALRRPRLVVFRKPHEIEGSQQKGKEKLTVDSDPGSKQLINPDCGSKHSTGYPSIGTLMESSSGSRPQHVRSFPRSSRRTGSEIQPAKTTQVNLPNMSGPKPQINPQEAIILISPDQTPRRMTRSTSKPLTAPPWRQAHDVHWCLVHDTNNYGISGTQHPSVQDFLKHHEVKPKKYYSNSRPATMSYVFVQAPTPLTINRIRKQIIFRALSDPNVAIVGYDAKVLLISEGDEETWKNYELFRFNSYDDDYNLLRNQSLRVQT